MSRNQQFRFPAPTEEYDPLRHSLTHNDSEIFGTDGAQGVKIVRKEINGAVVEMYALDESGAVVKHHAGDAKRFKSERKAAVRQHTKGSNEKDAIEIRTKISRMIETSEHMLEKQIQQNESLGLRILELKTQRDSQFNTLRKIEQVSLYHLERSLKDNEVVDMDGLFDVMDVIKQSLFT